MDRTLLGTVQRILNSMDSEAVQQTDETIESIQVTDELEFVFYDFLTKNDWIFPEKLIQLNAHGVPARPNYLEIPDNVWNIKQIRYDITDTNDNSTKIATIDYKNPQDFLELVQSRNDSDSNIDTVTSLEGVDMFIVNDDEPDWWTSFDDVHLVFDKYNSNVDSTLQNSKSQALAKERPTFPSTDSGEIPIPEWLFPAFESEARVATHFYFKGVDDIYDSNRAREGLSRQRRLNKTANRLPKKVKYGR